MSESQYSLDQEVSEEDYDVDEMARPKLRPANRYKNYNPTYTEPKPTHEKRLTRGKNNKLPEEIISMHLGQEGKGQNESQNLGNDWEEDEGGKGEDDDYSIFNIEIAQILWRRKRQNTDQDEYLVKYKGRSYLHTDWLIEEQINTLGKNMKNKINRFNKTHNQRLIEGNYDEEAIEEGKYFDHSYLEVDRIINATEMFLVIHQKKANQIKGKWSQSLMLVCSKLLNFTKNHICYGVLFTEPVDPLRDNCPDYFKIVANPMDLGTVLNKVYLDIYKSYDQFWKDIGLVFKNCLKFNKHPSDLYTLGQTLRQCALFLYDQWYHLSEQRYNQLKVQLAHLYIENAQNKIVEEKVEVKQGQNQVQQMKEQSEEKQVKNQKVERQNGVKKSLDSQFQNQNSEEEEPLKQEQANDNEYESSSKKKQEQVEIQEEEKDYLDMQQFYKKNMFLTDKKAENITTKQELQQLDPGVFNYDWLAEQNESGSKFMEHSYDHIDLADMRALDLNVEVNRLYMVKWKNLSYTEATWELQGVIGCPDKIHQFKNNNRALGKQARTLMDSQRQKHKILVQIEVNPKRKAKFSNAQISQLKNRLYFYDVGQKKQPFQYKQEQPHIYKNYKILRSYQTESLNWLIKSWYQKRNTILADQMGLGKTIQSIAFLYHLFTFENVKGPFLVIAPLSTLEHWKRTVQQWTNMNCILFYDQNGLPGRRSMQYYQWYHLNITMRGATVPSELNKFQVLITSYQVFLLDFQEVLMKIPFQFIVVDQAHRLKNKNAKILSALKRLPCKRALLLTGTPIQNNTSELWSLLNYIHPEKFGSHEDFRRNFGDLSSNQQVQRLNRILKPYMLRRMKEDVEQSIPPLQETIIDVQMTNVQKTIYKALYEKNREMLIKGLATNSSCNTNLNNLQIQLRKCCNHPFLIKQLQYDLLRNSQTPEEKMDLLLNSSGKMVLVKKLLQKCKNEGKKVLIFSQFTHMLQLIQQFLKWKDYKYERIDGQIKAKERQAAIDRYNNPNKKRDVFLLSTKAGGVGINLTSANVVIIYDSDWNPQNDVQATARAHRIGQKSQVQVYRLITCNTYETQMFERATQKLGLDKAIFIGGHFKQTGQNTNENKLSKGEMETLLKKGILGFLQNGEEINNQTFFEQNVDDIIQNNSRIAKYSLINGSCSFSKSRFVSDNADNMLKINDPNFWNIVLKNVQSPTQILLKKLKSKEYPQTLQGQKQLMLEASEQLNVIIQNKLSRNGLNADDQFNLTEFLTIINSERGFHKYYRDLAMSWLQEICRPSRRFKKFTADDLVIQTKVQPKKAVNLRSNNSNEEGDIFAEEDQQEEQEDGSEEKVRVDDGKKDQLLKRLCAFCQKPKCINYCMGFCKRSFHIQCRRIVQEEGYQNYDSYTGKLDINELSMDHQNLKAILNTNWTCSDCTSNLVACLVCKNKGLYYGAQYKKNKKGKSKKDTEQVQDPNKTFKRKNEVTKCSTANCAKYFHPKCIEQYDVKKLFKYIDTNSLHFRCSLHYCNVCGISGDTMSIFQCVRCPKALHTRCMDKQKIVKLSKKQFICDSHFKNKKDLKKTSQRFTAPINTLKKYLKAEKIEAKKKQSQEQSQKEEPEIPHNYSTRRNRHNPDDLESIPIVQQCRKIVQKPKEKMATLTYEEIGLLPIKDFDYKTYDKDWCRYCGCRYSSNFTQGPWGSKTLCTVHYISWKQNKTLDLSQYIEKPLTPIDPLNDQELKYLTTFAQKHPQMTYTQIIEYLQAKRNSKKLL